MFYYITCRKIIIPPSSGRIDRKIEFPLPDEKTKRRIFQIHTSRMTVADDVTLDDLILAKDDLSGADIKVRVSQAFHHELCSKTASIVKHVGIALSPFKHHIFDG